MGWTPSDLQVSERLSSQGSRVVAGVHSGPRGPVRCPFEGRRCPVRCPPSGAADHRCPRGVRTAVRLDGQRSHPPWLIGGRQARCLPVRTPPWHRPAGCPVFAAVTTARWPRVHRGVRTVGAATAHHHDPQSRTGRLDGQPDGLSIHHSHQTIRADRVGGAADVIRRHTLGPEVRVGAARAAG